MSLPRPSTTRPHPSLRARARLFGLATACALAGTTALAMPSPAAAGPCDSAATVAADTWQKFGTVAIAIGCGVGTIVAEMDFSKCYASGQQYSALTLSMVGWWNQMADNSWATIGPRILEVGAEPESGTLRLGGTRIFCTPLPVAHDAIKIRVTKDGGKAKTGVDICTMDKSGSASKVFEYTWAKGSDNVGDTESRTVNGAKDQILCVKLDNESATKDFSYKISAARK